MKPIYPTQPTHEEMKFPKSEMQWSWMHESLQQKEVESKRGLHSGLRGIVSVGGLFIHLACMESLLSG